VTAKSFRAGAEPYSKLNARAREDDEPNAALPLAGSQRFRAILLTSLTTFVGLLPLLGETSPQAKLLVPMAIALGFGVLFATAITLILVPVTYRLLEGALTWGQVEAELTAPPRRLSRKRPEHQSAFPRQTDRPLSVSCAACRRPLPLVFAARC
jgi:predicted RND superfamily exporter protein